jgi:GNAT superfamily N-acetyltransferase
MIIRNAIPADAPAMADLITQLGYPTTPEQMAARFARLSAEPNQQTWLAEDDLGPLGLIGLFKHQSWEYDDYFVRILALVVSSRARHQGVGEALIEAAERWGRDIGATRLVLNCGNRPERAIAHQFYPAMGFAPTTTGYSKTL